MAMELLDEKQVAEHTGIRVSTLQYFRRVGLGPKFSKLGRLVRYRPADIERWISENLRDPDSYIR